MASVEKTALITGFDGFVGPYLAECIQAGNVNVAGTVYAGLEIQPHHVSAMSDSVKVHSLDLTDPESVNRLVNEVRPDQVYHLAGISHVPTSWKNPALTWNTNVMGSLYLFDALRKMEKEVSILTVTSAEVYGVVPEEDLPVTEEAPLKPVNPYAASKAALDVMSRQWSRVEGMRVITVRPFSHTGPGQSPDFVCPGFAKQMAEACLEKREPVLSVGDLTALRDFTDVRDVVRGYRLLMEKGENGQAYNICSGQSRKISDILEILLSFCDKEIRVESDPEKLRPVTIPETRGSSEKITSATGWEPEIPFNKTLQDIYDHWHQKS